MTTFDAAPEGKKNHLWRHTIWHTDPELHPLGPHHNVEIYCCEESNGFAVWYVRKLPHAGSHTATGVENGDYLLAYFGRGSRDEAITHAVLSSTGCTSSELQIEALDQQARHSRKL